MSTIHSMKLHPKPFEKMQSGNKTVELRLNDEKRQQIKVGDIIEFASRVNPEETVTAEVTYLKTYPSFRDLFQGVKHFYPDWEEQGFIDGMYEYYSKEDEEKYGALEIGIKLIKLKNEMTAQDVADFHSELEKLGIDIWIDGGWGVDALLGKQTRTHGDLDIIVQQKDVQEIRDLLENRGYKVVPRDDLSDLNFHLRDDHGHEIDFTVIEFDEHGNGIYGPPENGEMNPADSFKGVGTINGHTVKCVSPEYAVKFRTGYELQDKDYQDVTALCEAFGLDSPEEYAHYAKN